MTIAEKLYTQGLISYPRTETNIFPKELDLKPLVEMQVTCISFVLLFNISIMIIGLNLDQLIGVTVIPAHVT